MYVTEDTIRTDPDTVKRLYTTAVRTAHAPSFLRHRRPRHTQRRLHLVQFVIREVVQPSGEKIRVDWHGHNDRGLAIANSLWALCRRRACVHGAANALGDRRHTPMELMMRQSHPQGLVNRDLSRLKELRHGRHRDATPRSAKLSRHR